MSPTSSVWLWFLCAVLLTLVCSKLTSMRLARSKKPLPWTFFLSPVFSTVSWAKSKPAARAPSADLFFKTGLFCLGAILSRMIYLRVVPALGTTVWGRGYFAVIPVYLLGQSISLVLDLIYLLTGWKLPSHFNYPPLARSIDEFWGRRWGIWVADWFRQVVFNRYRRSPVLAVWMVFGMSGVWHELLIDVPALLFYRINVLGTWTLYFFVQAVGMLIERKLLSRSPMLRWVFTWIVIVGPAPLALNQAILRMLGL